MDLWGQAQTPPPLVTLQSRAAPSSRAEPCSGGEGAGAESLPETSAQVTIPGIALTAADWESISGVVQLVVCGQKSGIAVSRI